MAYAMYEKLLNNTSVTLGAIETDTVVSDVVQIGYLDAEGIIIDIVVSGTTVATGITAKLQNRYSATGGWEDSKTVSVTGNDTFTIKLLSTVSGDQQYLPLRPQIRVVVSTGAGDAATVSSVRISNRSK